MKNTTLELIFPTPVMFGEMERDFTESELNFVKDNSYKIYQNMGNTTSLNTYILDEPELKELKEFCLEYLNKYITEVYRPKYNVKPYITQSWLNWTKPGEYHHTHEHPNSFVSGVLYINAKKDEDKIKFHKPNYQQLYIETNDYVASNSKTWWFNVKTGDIVLFPSGLTHNVETVTSNETRISLAFNTFLKGTLGDNRSLTELIND